MPDIVELLRGIVRAELDRRLVSHIGVVDAAPAHSSDTDAINYQCDVKLRGTDLVLKGVPLAADHLSVVAPPAKGDVVLVHFVGGDPDQPVVAGRFYSDVLRPPPYDENQIVLRLPPDGGESDRIDLTLQGGQNGKRSLELKLASDITVTVTDKTVAVKAAKLELTLNADSGEATVKTSGAGITLKDSDVTVTANGDLTLDAKGNVTVKAGSGLKLNASGTAELKGATVNIN